MGWVDYYRRRAVLQAALRQVARDGELSFDRVDGAVGVFSGLAELVLALHHRWSLLLLGRVELAFAEAREGEDPADVVSRAWLALAAAEPVLRAVLDAHERRPTMASALARENRMLALNAGLAHPDQHDAVLSEIGEALRTSLRPSGTAR
ncbi:hypothetical protein ALI22I_00700 [Saccharothrix sp. ALI-22-I]|uniref:hypothetical protein n=1 Tax=Saccharothrix sp. ALI-22-I TaxID=1933778 RepID=UPI00097C6820|nr:hypothetical protein [Saccharothrix sp. ALI-22-I]ONI93002.1 hypothetical protein ALI22I_00700 [Saccharothrix sp. ALI-22-I]